MVEWVGSLNALRLLFYIQPCFLLSSFQYWSLDCQSLDDNSRSPEELPPEDYSSNASDHTLQMGVTNGNDTQLCCHCAAQQDEDGTYCYFSREALSNTQEEHTVRNHAYVNTQESTTTEDGPTTEEDCTAEDCPEGTAEDGPKGSPGIPHSRPLDMCSHCQSVVITGTTSSHCSLSGQNSSSVPYLPILWRSSDYLPLIQDSLPTPHPLQFTYDRLPAAYDRLPAKHSYDRLPAAYDRLPAKHSYNRLPTMNCWDDNRLPAKALSSQHKVYQIYDRLEPKSEDIISSVSESDTGFSSPATHVPPLSPPPQDYIVEVRPVSMSAM